MKTTGVNHEKNRIECGRTDCSVVRSAGGILCPTYKYAKGKLLIIQQDGKTLDLKDGVYEFDDGKKYLVKDGAVIDKDKEKKEKKKDDKKDKLKGLKL